MSIFLIFLSFFISISLQDFICPTQSFSTNQARTGSIPSNVSTIQLIPSNYTCDYHFEVPVGFAIRLNFYTNYNYEKEEISFVDNLNRPYRLGTPMSNFPHWAVQPSAHVVIRTVTNTSKVLVFYEYVDISNFTKIQQDSGTVLNLASFEPGTFYTFNSKQNDSIVLQLSKQDHSLRSATSNYYIFDGADITTSKMIGRLSEYLVRAVNSTGSSITLVNFYNVTLADFVIANDKNLINAFTSYFFTILADNYSPFQQVDNTSLSDFSANTYYCADCDSLYLDRLQFYGSGIVHLVPLSPTTAQYVFITYNSDDLHDSNLLPQVVSSNFFTIISVKNLVTPVFNISPERYLIPQDGRKGSIFAPKQWGVTNKNSLSYYFSSTNDFKYSISFHTHHFYSNTTLEISIGRENGPILSKIFTGDTNNFNDFTAVGTFMNLTYRGDDSSNFRLDYSMTLQSSSAMYFSATSIMLTIMVFLW